MAINLDKSEYVFYSNKGDCYYKLQDYNSALKCYLESVKIYDEDTQFQNSIGNCYYALNEYEKSLPYYEAAIAIKLSPENIQNQYFFLFKRCTIYCCKKNY